MGIEIKEVIFLNPNEVMRRRRAAAIGGLAYVSEPAFTTFTLRFPVTGIALKMPSVPRDTPVLLDRFLI